MVEKAAALFRRSIDGYLGAAGRAQKPMSDVAEGQGQKQAQGEGISSLLADGLPPKTFDPTADAHYNLAVLFSTGRGVPKDPRRAFEHAKAAADCSQG